MISTVDEDVPADKDLTGACLTTIAEDAPAAELIAEDIPAAELIAEEVPAAVLIAEDVPAAELSDPPISREAEPTSLAFFERFS
jgi:hypothetical protein